MTQAQPNVVLLSKDTDGKPLLVSPDGYLNTCKLALFSYLQVHISSDESVMETVMEVRRKAHRLVVVISQRKRNPINICKDVKVKTSMDETKLAEQHKTYQHQKTFTSGDLTWIKLMKLKND